MTSELDLAKAVADCANSEWALRWGEAFNVSRSAMYYICLNFITRELGIGLSDADRQKIVEMAKQLNKEK